VIRAPESNSVGRGHEKAMRHGSDKLTRTAVSCSLECRGTTTIVALMERGR
jgi:hypothetical protein